MPTALPPTALVLSPHLDDAAFSCGGAMALLADAGWRVVMATAFTRSVVPATGFALACQLDKGLPADVDYMALRREEDRVAARLLGAEARWLDLPEAPHRNYLNATALFNGVLPNDAVWQPLSKLVEGLLAELAPALVLAPQGLGRHVDHLQMIRAVHHAAPHAPLAYFRDTPYAIRHKNALPFEMPCGLGEFSVGIETGMCRKMAAACAYASQVGFQFGGAEAAGLALREFATNEGQGHLAERFLGTTDSRERIHEHLSLP